MDRSGVGGRASAAVPVKLFARNATGLVREVGFLDQLLFGIFVSNFAIGPMLLFESGPWVAPGTNISVVMLVAGVMMIGAALTYAAMVSSMPRTGGDYVFLSRVVGGPAGFWISWAVCVAFLTAGAGGAAYLWAHSGVPFGFFALSHAWSSKGLADVASFLGTTLGTSLTGTFVIVVSALVLIWGPRTYFRVQRWLFVFGMIGALISLILLAATSRSGFATHFDAFTGTQGAYNSIVPNATKEGFVPGAFTLAGFLAVFPLGFQCFGFTMSTHFFAGELKGARQLKVTVGSMVGAVVAMLVWLVLLDRLLIHAVGKQWLDALQFLFYSGSQSYPVSTDSHFSVLSTMLTGNPVLLVLIAIGFIAWAFTIVPMNIIWPVRYIFAWAFDRLIPERMASVSERTHTPVLLVVVGSIITEVFFLLFQQGSMLAYWFASGFVPALTIGFGCLMAAFFPWFKPSSYKSSPARMSIFGIPVITIAGIIGCVGMWLTCFYWVKTAKYGMQATGPIVYLILVVLSGGPIFYALRWWRRRQGVDVSLAYREIPPE